MLFAIKFRSISVASKIMIVLHVEGDLLSELTSHVSQTRMWQRLRCAFVIVWLACPPFVRTGAQTLLLRSRSQLMGLVVTAFAEDYYRFLQARLEEALGFRNAVALRSAMKWR